MDRESLYCPNRRCRYYGRPFLQGQLVKQGSSHGQKHALCRACETSVSIRYGTAHIPANLVVDQWASVGECSSHHEHLFSAAFEPRLSVGMTIK